MASNADTVRELYEAFSSGDIATVLAEMDDQIYWEEPASMPFKNERGPRAIAENIFGPVRCCGVRLGLLADRAVDRLSQQVGMSVVAGRLLNHVQQDPTK